MDVLVMGRTGRDGSPVGEESIGFSPQVERNQRLMSALVGFSLAPDQTDVDRILQERSDGVRPEGSPSNSSRIARLLPNHS
jgi:hypothetical protein